MSKNQNYSKYLYLSNQIKKKQKHISKQEINIYIIQNKINLNCICYNKKKKNKKFSKQKYLLWHIIMNKK